MGAFGNGYGLARSAQGKLRDEDWGAAMAIVRNMTRLTLHHDSQHSEVQDCTYSIVSTGEGQKSLQIDTYGSRHRKIPGKKSQSIRFSPEAINQLRRILAEEL